MNLMKIDDWADSEINRLEDLIAEKETGEHDIKRMKAQQQQLEDLKELARKGCEKINNRAEGCQSF